MTGLLDLALWLAGAGHFLLFAVSAQVPRRLLWRREFAGLSAFNRKLVWVFGGYVVFTYAGFGVLTLVLHGEFLRGDRSAVALAVFIGLYWLVRLALDAVYLSHADWPAGRRFVLAHVALDLLFAFFTAVYLGLALFHLTR